MFEIATDFLNELGKNNNKLWLDQNRLRYNQIKQEFNDFTGQVLFRLADIDESLRFLNLKDCVFRINRDIRFAKNKLPYKTHFGASFSSGGKNGSMPGYYFQIEAIGNVMIGGGLFQPSTEQLLEIRKSISKDSSKLRQIITSPDFLNAYNQINDFNDLKTAPRGYHPTNKDIDLLRHNDFTVGQNITLANLNKQQLEDKIISNFQTLQPLIDYLKSQIL